MPRLALALLGCLAIAGAAELRSDGSQSLPRLEPALAASVQQAALRPLSTASEAQSTNSTTRLRKAEAVGNGDYTGGGDTMSVGGVDGAPGSAASPAVAAGARGLGADNGVLPQPADSSDAPDSEAGASWQEDKLPQYWWTTPKQYDAIAAWRSEFLRNTQGWWQQLDPWAQEFKVQQSLKTWQAATSLSQAAYTFFSMLDYQGYDYFVEQTDMALDFAQLPYHALLREQAADAVRVESTAMSGGSLGLMINGARGAVFTFRLRALAGIVRAQIGSGDEPYQYKCLSNLFASTDLHSLDGRLGLSCGQPALCRQCLTLYTLSGFGAYQGEELWGTRNGCDEMRVALGVVILRAWLCEDTAKRKLGLGPYWAMRNAALRTDVGRMSTRMTFVDTAHENIGGAVGTCADLNQHTILGNEFHDNLHVSVGGGGTGKFILGINCLSVHDALRPHRARLVQLAHEHMAAHGLGPDEAQEQVATEVLTGALIELSWQLVREGRGLKGFACTIERVRFHEERFNWLNSFPGLRHSCGRRRIGSQQQWEGELACDYGVSSSETCFMGFIDWQLEQVQRAAEAAGMGAAAGVGAAAARASIPYAPHADFERRRERERAHLEEEASRVEREEAEAAGDNIPPAQWLATLRKVQTRLRTTLVGAPLLSEKFALLNELYLTLHAAGDAPALGALTLQTGCPSARNPVCKQLFNTPVTVRALLHDTLCPLVVELAATMQHHENTYSIQVLDDDIKRIGEAMDVKAVSINTTLSPPLCVTIQECWPAIHQELVLYSDAFDEASFNPTVDPKQIDATLRRAACTMHCIEARTTNGRAMPSDRFAHIFVELLHAWRAIEPMVTMHHARLKKSHALQRQLFNLFAVIVRQDDPQSDTRITEKRIADFMKARTGGVPYSRRMRRMEEAYAKEYAYLPHKDARAYLHVGGAQGMSALMRREGCQCGAWDDDAAVIELPVPAECDTSNPNSCAEQATSPYRALLQPQLSGQPKSLGGWRPHCPGGGADCLDPDAIARIAHTMGPSMAEDVLRDELPHHQVQPALDRLNQFGRGSFFDKHILVDVDPKTGEFNNARPRTPMAGAGSDRRPDDLLSVS